MISIQVMSDLHLEKHNEYDTFTITPRALTLALLGDIGRVKDWVNYRRFLMKQLRQFKVVFLVPGNNEPRDTRREEVIARLKIFEQSVEKHGKELQLGKFKLLDRNEFTIKENADSITVMGCTLFSHVPAEDAQAVSRTHLDFSKNVDWNLEKHNAAHDQDLEFLERSLEKCRNSGEKAVIFTHYSPTRDSRTQDPRHESGPMTSMFSTDLLNRPGITGMDAWVWGHTHYNCDFKDDQGRRFVTNQRGRQRRPEAGFDSDLVLKFYE